jgi:hypothetical protein
MLPRALRNRIVIATLPGLLLGLAFIWRSSWISNGQRRFTLFDDAMISMSYGRTMADGFGLVWFPGAPRVEGITNPLWTFLMAGVHAIGFEGSSASVVMMLIGLCCIFGAAALSGVITFRLLPNAEIAPVITSAVVALSYPLIFWSLRGMEVGLLAVLTLALVLTTIDLASEATRSRYLVATLLIATGISTRVDFAVIVLICLGWLWIASGKTIRSIVPLAATLAGAISVSTVARIFYYGEWSPNTFTLKMTGVTLGERLQRGLITEVKLLPIVVLALTLLWFAWPKFQPLQRKQIGLLALIGISAMGYSAYVGGDAWESFPNRYVTPMLIVAIIATSITIELIIKRDVVITRNQGLVALALISLSGAGLFISGVSYVGTGAIDEYETSRWLKWGLLGMTLWGLCFALGTLIRSPRMRKLVVVTGGVGLLLVGSSFVGLRTWIEGELFINLDQQQTEVGNELGAITKDGAQIAVYFAGAPIYYSGRDGIDLLGKNDKYVASVAPPGLFYPGHNKWDYPYSITKQRPDVIQDVLNQLVQGTRKAPPSVISLLRKEYEPSCLKTSYETVKIYVRKDSKFINRSFLKDLNCSQIEASSSDQ